jgi:mono/diheme cytochrome c family protein
MRILSGLRTVSLGRLLSLSPVALTAALSAGCGSASDGTPATSGPVTTADTTYYEDVKPLFDAKCATCHVEGGVAPFTIDTYAAAKPYAESIKYYVSERLMPPWPAADGCTDYVADRSLTDAQIATITKWVDEGAAEGDPAKEGAPLDTGPEVALSRVDRTIELAAPYTPQIEPDDYRCFLVDWPEADTTYVTGFRANPGNLAVVHHVIAFLAEPGDVADAQALDDAEEGPGYTCYGGPGFNANWLGAWAPGGNGTDFPAGTGLKVLPGSKVVVQIHYNTLVAGPQPDRTSMDFRVDASVEKEAWVQPWANPSWLQGDNMSIPAATEDVSHSWAYDPTKVVGDGGPLLVYSGSLHMHQLGTAAKLDVVRKAGDSQCLLDIPRWDFNWQGSYGFEAPMVVNPGDKLRLECHWDNTTTGDVAWGEGTNDEMCLGVFYATEAD